MLGQETMEVNENWSYIKGANVCTVSKKKKVSVQ